MDGAKLKALKQIFPELRNFEGRSFGFFLRDLATKVEDWAIWARLELGRIKCYDRYIDDPICVVCANFDADVCGGSCKVHSNLGETWEDWSKDRASLRHPNTGEWYWCIKECPDFAKKGE